MDIYLSARFSDAQWNEFNMTELKMVEPEKSTVPNLQCGMFILEFLSKHRFSATIAELTKRLGHPSASFFRITQELAEMGYLQRDSATKKFNLTTITNRRIFREQLAQISKCGYALARAEGLERIHCVVGSALDRHGSPVRAIIIAGPASRIIETEFERLGKPVAEAALKIESEYGQ